VTMKPLLKLRNHLTRENHSDSLHLKGETEVWRVYILFILMVYNIYVLFIFYRKISLPDIGLAKFWLACIKISIYD
jgi:hypothetical protein